MGCARIRKALVFLTLAVIAGTTPLTTASQTPVSEVPWITEGDVACPRISLIFNIGLGEAPSEAILQTLIQEGVEATMFPTGQFARTYPEYLRSLNDTGFPVGVHGDAGLQSPEASGDAIHFDIRASIDAIESVIGRGIDPYFTGPAAESDEHMDEVVASEGLQSVGWKVSAPDAGAEATDEAVYRSVVDNVYPGAIVELHLDGPATDVSTAMALPRIVDDLRARGYEFVTIEEMLEPCPGPTPDLPETVTMTGLDVHGLHCKSAPAQGATLIRILIDGDTVPVRGPVFDGWLPVSCADRPGWVKATALPDFP
jgi:peptidoglycan/xylan/chitin deacetylase (PgdA/CDA1 family)